MGDLSLAEPGSRKDYPNTPYKFSPEELRVLSRCNRESFYQRSLPMSTILGLSTYWCVKSGYLKPHPKYGSVLKVAGAVVVGYFMGKLSYQQRCAEYFMTLPNSEVGEMLRKRRQQRYGSLGNIGSPFQSDNFKTTDAFSNAPLSSFVALPPSDIYSDLSESRSSFQDIDTERPLNEGLSDVYRPSVDFPCMEEDTILPSNPGVVTTYEDLRRKNREQYLDRSTKPYRNVPTSDDVPSSIGPNPNSFRPPSSSQSEPDQRTQFSPAYSKQKNIYGDIWEK